MTGPEVDTRRIRAAFDRDLSDYQAPARLAERARTGGRRRAIRRRIYQAVMAVAFCAAVVAGVVVAPLAGGGPSGLPSAAAIGQAMLGALPSVSGDIVYEKQIAMYRGKVAIESQLWIWPAEPAPGHRVRLRNIFAQRLQAHVRNPAAARLPAPGQPLTLIEDNGLVYKYQRQVALNVNALLTQVCYLRTGRCGGGEGPTAARTWSRASFQIYTPAQSDIAQGSDFSPAAVAHAILTGQWRVFRHGWIDRQPAIELRGLYSVIAGHRIPIYPPCPQPVPASVFLNDPCPGNESLLWVNARTHLPIRWIGVAGTTVVSQEDYTYLPPTAATQSLLRVPIPRGFPRSQESEPGAPGY
jgi:hypothetical protein